MRALTNCGMAPTRLSARGPSLPMNPSPIPIEWTESRTWTGMLVASTLNTLKSVFTSSGLMTDAAENTGSFVKRSDVVH